ncbi:MAG: ABC transporter permease [Bacteroidota bacterium]
MSQSPQPYHDPPRFAMRFLSWFCAAGFREEIEGDLWELFQEEIEEHGLKRARRRFFFTSLRYLRPYFFGKKFFPDTFIHRAMIQHHVKIASRQLWKQKYYSLINIGGLSLGVACCLLIMLYVQHETGYDQHVSTKDRLYRITAESGSNAESGRPNVVAMAPLADALMQDYPEVEKAARFNPFFFEAGSNLVRKVGDTQSLFEAGFTYADQEILEVFDLPIVAGERTGALVDPLTVVISDKIARKYFPEGNAVGQTLILNDNEKRPYKITAVMRDFPTQSSLQYDFFLSLEGLDDSQSTQWMYNNYPTFVLLKPGVDPEALTEKFSVMVDKYMKDQLMEAINVDVDKARAEDGWYYKFDLQPITETHLYSANFHDPVNRGDIRYVWIFSAISIFILLIACINFMNLSTARSANRAKEVGIRKVIGSQKRELVQQFLTESILTSLISFAIGLGLVTLLLEPFNTLAGKELSLPWTELWFIPSLLGGALFVGILAGSYPAMFLSRFMPIKVLKGTLSQGSKHSRLRSGLVVFQFAASILLIIGTMVVYRQMEFIQDKKLGFDKENVLIIRDAYTLGRQTQQLKDAFKKLPEVQSATVSGFMPVKGFSYNDMPFWPEGKNNPEDQVNSCQFWTIDSDYLETMDIKLVDGRNFTPGMATDSGALIINQTLARQLNFEHPTAQRITTLGDYTYPIIGVVEDFHFESLKDDIRGVAMRLGFSTFNIAIRYQGDLSTVLPKIKATWSEFAPNQSIRYTFLDEKFDAMYDEEVRTGSVFGAFAILAIVIACLGLFALATFVAEQRRKEICIRKVLGANMGQIFILMTQNFFLLIGIALVVATPLAWYLMNLWLQDFSYKIDLSWDLFAVAGLAAALITLITVSYQAIQVALADPALSLRNE